MKNASLIKTLLVLSCLYSSTYAQKNKAIYSVIINNKEEITKSPYYSYYKIAQENSNQFTFHLIFSKDRSDFLLMII